MNNNLLITGATGTIGRELVKALLVSNTAFDIMSSKAETTSPAPVRKASFESVEQLTQAFAGIDTLFVLLPLVPHKLQLARNVAQAAKAAGVQHIVRASGAGADPQAGFSMPRMQGEIDEIFTQSGIHSTFLRNAGFMQNYITFQRQMVKDGMLYAATNNAAQSLIDVRDIAAVAALILRNPQAHSGKAYTLTGGESLTDTERANVLSLALGKAVGYTPISVEASSRVMRNEWHMPAPLVDWMDSLNTLIGMGYAAAISPDTEHLLNRKPISFTDFSRNYASSWK